jgi:pimeloyl-ACP methyl ester carboxylesterase
VEERPETRYARSGDVAIAYQVVGEGAFDIVVVPGFVSHVELGWDVPGHGELRRRLAAFARLIVFDKRGTGLSDRAVASASFEQRIDDIRAVMDAAGSTRAALVGISEGAPMSLLFAATYPSRVAALVLVAPFARMLWAPDYPWGISEDAYAAGASEETRRLYGSREEAIKYISTAVGESAEALADYFRSSASPGAVDAINHMNREIDVRQALPAVAAPTLLIRGEHDHLPIEGARFIAERIPGARLITLEGAHHLPVGEPLARACNETETFLEGVWEGGGWKEREPDRVLATVLFSDIVGSSERAVELGDRSWRQLLQDHHATIRRELARFRGTEIDTAGDSFFASFDGPARAVRCGLAIVEAVRELGLELRVGVHSGECELIDGKVGGIAVHIGARVSSQATAGQVLVSGTVKDLVVGSGIDFEDRGTADLKGIPGEWRLWVVRSA